MKKKFIILSIIITFSSILNAQHIKNGVYANRNELLCIQGDTMLYYHDSYWYKGPYIINADTLYWNKNILLGRNASITKEKCSQDSIELKLITKHKHYLIGMPSNDTNIYEYESDIYAMFINKTHLVSRHASGIYIAKGQFSDQILSSGFLLDDSGAGFTDCFNFPLEYGTRYIVKQKYYKFRPIIVYLNDYKIIKYNEMDMVIMLKWTPEDKYHTTLKYVSPNCDSCFKEFKNRFPLLFE